MSYLQPPPLALAHRGGVALPANAGIENSIEAIANAIALGIEYVETDVRASSDGEAFAFHDTDLRRVAASAEHAAQTFESLTAAQIHAMVLDGGAQVPTVARLLESFPTTRFNIDVKTVRAVPGTVSAIRAAGAYDRVLIASFSHRRLQLVRRMLPEVATSMSPWEVAALRFGRGRVRSLARRNGAVAAQVCEYANGVRIVTADFVQACHDEGMQVHVWTVDAPADIERLLDLGVDGIITDRPDVLREVLRRRHQWRGDA